VLSVSTFCLSKTCTIPHEFEQNFACHCQSLFQCKVVRVRHRILYLLFQSPLSCDCHITTEVLHYCRCCEGEGEARYRNIQRSAVASIKHICKVVNQTMLLQNLHDTRMCDQLLEQDASEDIWNAGQGMS
jgi:hypothetical protein